MKAVNKNLKTVKFERLTGNIFLTKYGDVITTWIGYAEPYDIEWKKTHFLQEEKKTWTQTHFLN